MRDIRQCRRGGADGPAILAERVCNVGQTNEQALSDLMLSQAYKPQLRSRRGAKPPGTTLVWKFASSAN